MTMFINNDKLTQYGINSGQAAGVADKNGGGKYLSGRLISRDAKNILNKLSKLYESFRDTGVASKEGEWLCDNMYIVRREAAGIAEDFRHAGSLSAAADGRAAVLSAAMDLVRSGLGYVDGERTALFLEGFMKVRRLPEKELMLFAASIRLELLRYLLEKLSTKDEAEKNAENVFKTMFRLAATDLYKVCESVNPTEKILRRDPSDDYRRMNVQSRALYRREISRLAAKNKIEEAAAAEKALALSSSAGGYKRHVGYYIFREPLGGKTARKPYGLYIGLNVLLTLIIPIFLALRINSLYVFIFTLLPVSEAVKYLLDRLIMRCVPPNTPPMLELTDNIPADSKTVCVTAALLTSPQAIVRTIQSLEEFRLANRIGRGGTEVCYGILADLPESKTETSPKDIIALKAAEAEIKRLNEKYGGGFCFFLRKRTYSERDRVYRGWERKRGAVLELIRLLKEGRSGVELLYGSSDIIQNVKYIIILDSDTRLNAGTAAELIGTISHPLNKPVVDIKEKTVVHGSGIITPKIGVDLHAANRSDFARIFAGQGGLDPYGSAGSDVYQDIFLEGSFAGKGIISVEAAYTCLDKRLPLNTLLSHDLIEGEYLRCMYAGNIELTDGFPSSLLSYFERQHRWIRGDWQTIKWLFGRVRDEAGRKNKNPLTPLGKWKIFDNLRRSLVPVMTFLALYISCILGGHIFALTAFTVLFCLAVKVVVNSLRKPDIRNKTYRTGVLTAAASDFMQFFILIILLPYIAFINASAIITSLYRLYISKQNLLKWVTAAESDSRRRRSICLYYSKMFICPLAAITGFILSPYAPSLALFVLWLASPALGYALSRERNGDTRVSAENRAFLLHSANDIWRYFERYITAERNWLPPDNIQEEPVEIIAERTSPTNIGLALLSILTAADLALCEKKTALRLIENMLQTVGELPKYRGHLYNWYDIKKLAPLRPEYVSTVDSGNFVGCLLALSAGLYELGEERLAQTAKKLADNTELGFLYDRERRLMRIGLDVRSGEASDCWYDLLESEARITSYIAVARGVADKRHWRRLGRILAEQREVCGLASWTGTMFEYFMPCLLMPSYKHSLLHESLIFCYLTQRRRNVGGVWGISESAFYYFDACMNYSYKAHGVQGAALKRGMDRDMVISPYSTFLALGMNVNACVKNLKRLRRLGMEGRFGFYEAADFTASRIGSAEYEKVRCFMTHHLAMSIVAINNALKGDIMVKRFMSHPEMRAFSELLQEKGPVGQLIKTDRSYRAEEKPERIRNDGWNIALTDYDLEYPVCFPLSNGSYSILFSELGSSRSKCGDKLSAAYEPRRFTDKHGIGFYLLIGDELISLQPAPEFKGRAEYGIEFTGNALRQYAKADRAEITILTFTAADECGEKRTVFIKNRGDSVTDYTLVCCFEPVLANEASYAAHPAFSKLALETNYKNGIISIRRRAGGENKPLGFAFACSEPYTYDTDRVATLGRGGIRALPAALKRPAGSTHGPVADPCVLARVKLSLKPGEKKEVCFSYAVSGDEESASTSAERILGQRENENNYFFDVSSLYSMTGRDIESAVRLLSPLVYETSERKQRFEKYGGDTHGRSGLWRFGISGDCPILLADGKDIVKPEKALSLFKYFGFLTKLGFELDLVLIIAESGEYGRPEYSALLEQAEKLGLGGFMNRKGGIHIISGFESELNEVRALADIYINGAISSDTAVCQTNLPARRTGVRASHNHNFFIRSEISGDSSYKYEADGSFSFSGGNKYGRWAWSNMLTNGSLGFIATDAGTGNMWLGNSREFRLNRWINDPLALYGSERLELIRGNERVSLFGGKVSYGFGWAVWVNNIGSTQTELTAFVAQASDVKVFILKLNNPKSGDKISYFTQAVLGKEEDEQKTVAVKAADGILLAENGCVLRLSSNLLAEKHYTDELSFLTGGGAAGGRPCLAAEYSAAEEMIIAVGVNADTELAAPEKAERALEAVKRHWEEQTGFIRIKTPCPELDAYINGWAAYQIIASRLLGRNSIYQSGGAYGFRDQLQDICALIDAQPETARKHIIKTASHQYKEGDVQHWWHEPLRGVRTHCSDDLLWLPYAVSQYVKKTGDRDILDERITFLSSPALDKTDKDRYEIPETAEAFPLKEHCERAINLVLKRGWGSHGLLLIGSGDWNDGFDNLGAGGESVWLTWFAAYVMNEYADITDSGSLRKTAEDLARRAETAFDEKSGQYMRGFYGDGKQFGKEGDESCAIDSIAQSFSVISGLGDTDRGRAAVLKAVQKLSGGGLTRLFDPPFKSGSRPGYICSYLEGVRENGGQYTHAAVWLALACLKAGETDRGWNILRDILPYNKNSEEYKGEPYVIAADVYTNPYLYGRAGWTWYTGAAGWYLRTVVEELLGIKAENGGLTVKPQLPSGWAGYDAEYTVRGKKYRIYVTDGGKTVKLEKD
jgi:cyclic beta-1,2-glucan synthetase